LRPGIAQLSEDKEGLACGAVIAAIIGGARIDIWIGVRGTSLAIEGAF